MCMRMHVEVRFLYWVCRKDCVFIATPGVLTLAQSIRVERHDGLKRFDSSIGHSQEGFSIYCET